MITAKEARALAFENNMPNTLAEKICKLIQDEAKKGEYELIYESSHCSGVNNTTYKILQELGYKVYLTVQGVFLIHW
jgi:hypothetical protein